MQSITFRICWQQKETLHLRKMTPCFSRNYLLNLNVRVGNRELPLWEHSSQKVRNGGTA